MAQDSTQIRAQIDAVRARLEEDLDELVPVFSLRLHRARRTAQIGGLAVIALIARRLLPGRKRKHRRQESTRGGCCSKCRGKSRRR